MEKSSTEDKAEPGRKLTNLSGLTVRRWGMLGITVRGWLPGWFSEHNRCTVHYQQRLDALVVRGHACTASKWWLQCALLNREEYISSALQSVQKVSPGGVWAVGPIGPIGMSWGSWPYRHLVVPMVPALNIVAVLSSISLLISVQKEQS